MSDFERGEGQYGEGRFPARPTEPPRLRVEPQQPTGHGLLLRRPAALVATVALVAAVVGGGTGALVGENWIGERGGSASTSTTARNVATEGTVAGAAERLGPSVVEISADGSTGSGVVISEDGEILTNNHVIADADRIQVRFQDGGTATAEVVGTEPELDTALLKADGVSGLTAAKLGDSDAVGVGDQVVAIGSPAGLTGSVTSGIVSALDREVTTPKAGGEQRQPRGQDDSTWPFGFGERRERGGDTTTYQAIQTDASINPGNSGGALAGLDGSVIGINTAIYDNGSPSTEAGSVGLGFAIPINDVKEILDDLRAGDAGGDSETDGDGGGSRGPGPFGV